MTRFYKEDHRSIRGTISYTSKKPERLDQVRGREYFHVDVHSDGKRTITAHCEIDDRPSVMRDITYSIDEDWYPMDCFVRLSVDDKFMGSGWFRFGPDFAECETNSLLDGRVSQRMETNGRLKTFQNHAIACDSWHMRLFDLSKPATEVQSIDEMLLSSPDHRGATGTDAVSHRLWRRVCRGRDDRSRSRALRRAAFSFRVFAGIARSASAVRYLVHERW